VHCTDELSNNYATIMLLDVGHARC